MTYNFQRPNVPYQGESLKNDDRYQLLTRTVNRPPADDMLDSDFNYLIYAVRQLDTAISQIESEGIIGSDDPGNADALLATDGDGAVFWTKIQDRNIIQNSITNLSIYPQTITATEIQDGTIPAQKLAQDCVTTSKILNQNVTREKLALTAVGTPQLADSAVGTGQLAALAVTREKLGLLAVGAPQLGLLAVDTPQLAALAVTTGKLALTAVGTGQLADSAVTNPKLGSKSVTYDKIADSTITFGQINSNFTATKSQQQAASSSSVYVSPATQQYHPSAISANVVINGNTGAIVAGSSYNVSSVEQVATGAFKVTTAAFVDTSYTCVGMVEDINPLVCVVDSAFSKTTTQIQVKVYNRLGNASSSGFINLIFTGKLA